jgi:hypothetical protein
MTDNVIPLPRTSINLSDFVDEVEAMIDKMGANRAFVTLFNAEGERVNFDFRITRGDVALIAIDCLSLAMDPQEE